MAGDWKKADERGVQKIEGEKIQDMDDTFDRVCVGRRYNSLFLEWKKE